MLIPVIREKRKRGGSESVLTLFGVCRYRQNGDSCGNSMLTILNPFSKTLFL